VVKNKKMKILFTKEIPNDFLKGKLNPKLEYECTPLLKIETLLQQDFKSKILIGTNYIVTSQNAVEAISHLKLTEHFFVVGKKTAKKLNELNFHVEHFENSAAELGKYLVENKIPVSWNYFCGNNRRDELIQILEKNNHPVNEIICYNSVPVQEKLNTENHEAIVFFSPLGVQSFFQNNQIQAGCVIFAIGNTTKFEIKKFTKNPVLIPEIPTIESLIDKINMTL
jgi:uroporphyrinogen-III synthase